MQTEYALLDEKVIDVSNYSQLMNFGKVELIRYNYENSYSSCR